MFDLFNSFIHSSAQIKEDAFNPNKIILLQNYSLVGSKLEEKKCNSKLILSRRYLRHDVLEINLRSSVQLSNLKLSTDAVWKFGVNIW